MSSPLFVIADSDEELADNLCNLFAEIVSSTVIEYGFASAAISGGRTPDAFFRKLASERRDTVDWNKIILFWTDERCVPPDDPESNFGRANELLLSRVGIPPKNVFRIIGEDDPETEAIRYSEMIEMNLRSKKKFPSFDFILLGVGEDGHTASIFPGDEHLFSTNDLTAVTTRPSDGQQRITLTGTLINNSRNIAIAATGSGKRDILTKVLRDSNGETYPVKLVSPVSGQMYWFLTKESLPSNII